MRIAVLDLWSNDGLAFDTIGHKWWNFGATINSHRIIVFLNVYFFSKTYLHGNMLNEITDYHFKLWICKIVDCWVSLQTCHILTLWVGGRPNLTTQSISYWKVGNESQQSNIVQVYSKHTNWCLCPLLCSRNKLWTQRSLSEVSSLLFSGATVVEWTPDRCQDSRVTHQLPQRLRTHLLRPHFGLT